MGERLARQLFVLAAALALWAVWAEPALYALALGYVAACALASWLDLARLTRALSPPAIALLALLGLLPGGAALWRAWPALLEHEGLPIALASFGDRLRLEASPSIAPPLISADEPQTYFVHAADARAVRVRLAPGIAERAAEALGHEVFRLDYDPRRDGVPKPGDGPVEAQLVVDGTAHAREMLAVTPLAHPRWLCVSADGARAAAVSRETDELLLITARGLERRVQVGDAPSDCAFVDPGFVAVSHERDAAVWLVEAASGAAAPRFAVGEGQSRLARSPDGTQLAVARGGRGPEIAIVTLNGNANGAVLRVPLPAPADWLAFGRDDRTLVAATRADARLHRFALDGAAPREDATLALGRPAVTLARAPDGARLLVAVTDFRADGRAHLGNHFVQDQLLEIDVASLRVVRRLLTARRTPRQSRAGDVDSGLSPLGVAFDGRGGLLVAFAGSDELWALPRLDAEPERIDLAPEGVLAPHGVAELAGGTRVVTSPSQGVIALLSTDRGSRARVLRVAPDDDFLRSHALPALARRHGERGFYESTRSGLSCQSCHLHADSDRAAHNLGDRALLPTLSVRGLLATPPYLRDGSYGHLGDLDYVAQVLYRGYLRRDPGRVPALEAYLGSLPRVPSAVGIAARDPRAERRGLDAFVKAGCPGCHAPPAFSALGQHRPAALFPDHRGRGPYELLDTPSLLSVGATAPYLGDGRARTLEAVLVEHNRANRHGDVARLAAGERRDLLRFLEAL